jgi:molybdopterin converting factor small subunit
MNIEVRLFMHFRKYLPAGSQEDKALINLDESATIADLLHTLGVPDHEQKLLVINGVSLGTSGVDTLQVLRHKDVVMVFPPVSGG